MVCVHDLWLWLMLSGMLGWMAFRMGMTYEAALIWLHTVASVTLLVTLYGDGLVDMIFRHLTQLWWVALVLACAWLVTVMCVRSYPYSASVRGRCSPVASGMHRWAGLVGNVDLVCALLYLVIVLLGLLAQLH